MWTYFNLMKNYLKLNKSCNHKAIGYPPPLIPWKTNCNHQSAKLNFVNRPTWFADQNCDRNLRPSHGLWLTLRILQIYMPGLQIEHPSLHQKVGVTVTFSYGWDKIIQHILCWMRSSSNVSCVLLYCMCMQLDQLRSLCDRSLMSLFNYKHSNIHLCTYSPDVDSIISSK